MKELELTLDNLLSLGLTPEILKTDFENWVFQNKDILIDFDKNIIYTGLLAFDKRKDNLLEIAKGDLLRIGKTPEEVEALIEAQREDQMKKIDDELKHLPDEAKRELLIHAFPKMVEKVENMRKLYFNFKLRNLIDCESEFSLSSHINLTNSDKKGDDNVDNDSQSQKEIDTQKNKSLFKDENATLHEKIKQIINHPANVLMDITDDYIGLDNDGNELFADNIEEFIYDYEKEIVEPFKDINYLTTKLMENKAQSVVDGYLNIIFKELMEIMPIIVDYCNDTVSKQKNYPKNRYMFFYMYYRSLGQYYEFLIEFVNKETFSKFNKIIIDDLSYFTIKDESPIQENTLTKPVNKSPEVINIEFSDKLDDITDKENPYPKIFKNNKAYTIFKNLLDEFGNTKENLSNYSFVFHKMTYEDLIHNDLKQKSYFDFLGEFDISISRIKSLNEIGKIAFRESIYFKSKS